MNDTPMMRFLMLTCREATRLTDKRLQSGHLSLPERLQLKFHLRMCAHCQRYADQSAVISAAIDAKIQALEDEATHTDEGSSALPYDFREKLLKRLEQQG